MFDVVVVVFSYVHCTVIVVLDCALQSIQVGTKCKKESFPAVLPMGL